jgi:hypothetical protein
MKMMQGLRPVTLLLLCALIETSWGFVPLLPCPTAQTQRYTTTPTESSDQNTANDGDVVSFVVPEGAPTFYEILGAEPTATKVDLKRKYVDLARVTHPDALIGASSTVTDKTTEFSEIALAYKTLSNEKTRRSYDRTLAAEEFKQNVEKVATDVANTAGPRVKKAFDDFALPFLRRTTVTTVATVSAAVDRLYEKDGAGLNLGSAVASGRKAAEAAGRVVDGIENLEKSKELEER